MQGVGVEGVGRGVEISEDSEERVVLLKIKEADLDNLFRDYSGKSLEKVVREEVGKTVEMPASIDSPGVYGLVRFDHRENIEGFTHSGP